MDTKDIVNRADSTDCLDRLDSSNTTAVHDIEAYNFCHTTAAKLHLLSSASKEFKEEELCLMVK